MDIGLIAIVADFVGLTTAIALVIADAIHMRREAEKLESRERASELRHR